MLLTVASLMVTGAFPIGWTLQDAMLFVEMHVKYLINNLESESIKNHGNSTRSQISKPIKNG